MTAAVAGALTAATYPSAAAALAVVVGKATCATSGGCVSGANISGGPGVAGASTQGIGVSGTGETGVSGSSKASSGGTGVSGSATLGYGVHGSTTGHAPGKLSTGVLGTSSNGVGVTGIESSSGYGVVGTASGYGIGVDGYVLGQGVGVYGASVSGDGVYGYASGNGAALHGHSEYGSGVYAESAGGGADATVVARNTSGNAGDFWGAQAGVVGRASAGGFPLILTDAKSADLFYVDGSGNVYYHGTMHSFLRTASGVSVDAYSAKTSAPTVEDTGTARLVRGSCSVRLDPTFAATIDPAAAYRVFLTPSGDTRGLYVALRTSRGFAVRESQGGHSTVDFDYRIVATSLGDTGRHMGRAIAAAEPLVPLPAAAREPLRVHPFTPPALPPSTQ